jgi:hypothetical protein
VQAGLRVGLRVGLGVGIGSDAAVVSADGLSGKLIPANSAEWSALGLTPATDTWSCQAASGNLVSDIGTVLTANASPLYQQSVTGWTRKAVGFNGGASQRFQHNTYNNIATTSIMVLLYMIVDATPGAVSGVLATGTSVSNAGVAVTTVPRLRARSNGGFTDSTSPYNTAVVPVVFQFDVTGSAVRLFTESEKLLPTFGAGSGSILGIGTGTAATFRCLYLAAWKGSAAEQSTTSTKAMLQALRWSPTWTP